MRNFGSCEAIVTTSPWFTLRATLRVVRSTGSQRLFPLPKTAKTGWADGF